MDAFLRVRGWGTLNQRRAPHVARSEVLGQPRVGLLDEPAALLVYARAGIPQTTKLALG